jgi:hypothetical protein
MTRYELPDSQLLETANHIIELYDQAQTSVFKLMSSDSVPKFLREPKYTEAIRKHTADAADEETGTTGSNNGGSRSRPSGISRITA